MHDTYSNFIRKLMEVIDKRAPVKNKIIKRNSQEWFDSEIPEKLIIRDKHFKKYKKSRLHKRFIKEHHIVSKISMQKRNKLKECIGKPKDLWKTIKSLGLLDKYGAFAENQIVKHDTKSILKAFKSFYSNLAGNLLSKPPKLPNRYTINFVSDYCKKLSLFENLSEN